MPLRPNRTRHFINFHNPELIGYEFTDVGGGAGESVEIEVFTNKLVRDLEGDIVWMLSRRRGRKTYYLYGKFRVEGQGDTGRTDYRYAVFGRGTLLPQAVPLNRLPWFEKLLTINPNLSQGFQSVLDKDITTGLSASFAAAKKKAYPVAT